MCNLLSYFATIANKLISKRLKNEKNKKCVNLNSGRDDRSFL
jgi:hypothetical protein